MSSYAKFNAGGMATFSLGFAVTLVFFGYTLCINPGPTSGQTPTVALPYSTKEQAARADQWRTSSPESIALGQGVYATNCAYCHTSAGHDQILENLKAGKAQVATSEVGLYGSFARGISGQHRFSFIGKRERWALQHYLMTQVKGLKSNSAGEWTGLLATDY